MMPEQTIVAVYDKFIDADAAVRDLEAANVPSQAISRHEGRTERNHGAHSRGRVLGAFIRQRAGPRHIDL